MAVFKFFVKAVDYIYCFFLQVFSVDQEIT